MNKTDGNQRLAQSVATEEFGSIQGKERWLGKRGQKQGAFDQRRVDIGKILSMESVNLVYALIGFMALVSIAVIAVPLIAVLNPEAFYQGLLLILMPLVVLSLCLSGFSIFLTVCMARSQSANLKNKPDGMGSAVAQDVEARTEEVAPEADPSRSGSRLTDAQAEQIFLRGALTAGREYGLTQREIEVLELLLQGRNAERISQNLVISKHTAKTHIYNIYRKVGSSSQQELIDLFQKNMTVPQKGVSHARPVACGLRAS